MTALVHLSAPGRGSATPTSVVVDIHGGVPIIRHWGARLPDGIDLDAFVHVATRALGNGNLDIEAPLSIVPEHGVGFSGRPGLAGHRPGGRDWAPRFAYRSHRIEDGKLVVVADDDVASLVLETTIELGDALTVGVALTNESSDEAYQLDRLDVTLPLPAAAVELLQFTGRWTRELHPYRMPFERGAFIAENRSGRTSHEHIPLVFAGTRSFGEWTGQVWGAHLAWSGNHHVLAEVLPDGRRSVQMGELLHPGEISLAPGATYRTPDVIAVYSDSGLTPASWGFHSTVRARERFTTPRPVLLNTWEAVYFDHDTDRLIRLADAAAAVGVERFVLDDGWFGSRRDDRRGLGDWTVSPEVHPGGLSPLIDHVVGLGMDFGIWVEPEMVNPDSDLYRAHPEWALTTDGYEPVLGRHQLVLDLAHPGAYEHVLLALDALLRDHEIAYVKWDMNRVHVQASGASNAAGTHAQTLALYRMLDELRERHPHVEIESCASGGGRIDHEILRRTDRVWTSDCNDALERQIIQRGASMFIPPEVMGAHIGPDRSDTTGRRHDLDSRAATALFGHLGLELDLLALSGAELAAITAWVAVHQQFRPLLHHGDVVRFDPADDGILAHGVYSADRTEALIAVTRVATAMSLVPAPLLMPGLTEGARYRIVPVRVPGGPTSTVRAKQQPVWLGAESGVTLSGRELAVVGLQLPLVHPDSITLIRLFSSSAADPRDQQRG